MRPITVCLNSVVHFKNWLMDNQQAPRWFIAINFSDCLRKLGFFAAFKDKSFFLLLFQMKD